ncbi:MAG: aromatic ring-hydroxylating dioxygenase subunit alpha [Cyanobacteriota bacterium]
MLVSRHSVLKRFWYPVIPLTELHREPKRFVLLGSPLVLWLNGSGQPACVEDRCCHRTARLSQGCVVEGALQCPYHGWQFNGSGACVRVPQLSPEQGIPSSYRVQSYACQEQYGYVWVSLSPEPLTGIPELPEARDPAYRLIPEFYETWRVSGLRLMENEFDNAHPHFVHANSFGDQHNPVPPERPVIGQTEFTFETLMSMSVLNPELQQKNLGIHADKTTRHAHSIWYLPFARKTKITYPSGVIHILFTVATPIDDQHSQIVQFVLRNDTEYDAPAANVIAFDRQVTLEDKQVLETTDPDTPLDIHQEEHLFTDKPGILMRRKLAALFQKAEEGSL